MAQAQASTIYQIKLYPPNKSYTCFSTFTSKSAANLAIADMIKRGYHTTLTVIRRGS
jgi:hypothetical protein